jgi:hypothetical protein
MEGVTSLDRISGEIGPMLGRLGPGAPMPELTRAWPAAVGPAIAQNAWPARLARDGTLHVAASSSAWAFELGLLADTIAARLAEALGSRAPARLRFAPGPLPEPALEAARADPRKRPNPSSETRRQAADLSASIEDEELRELVARAAAASLAESGDNRPLW